MFHWERLGRLFDPTAQAPHSWIREFAQSPSALVLPDRIRVFFCARPAPEADGLYRSRLAYIDLDRGEPTRVIGVCDHPLLELGDLGTFDEFGTNPVSVIADGDRLRVYYAGWTRCESVPFNGAIGVAFSNDCGESFHRIGPGPVLSYSPDEPFLLGSPRIHRFGGQWLLGYVSGKVWLPGERPEPVYKIRMAVSTDGISWRKLGRDLLPDRLGPHECQACPDVLHHEGRYHMFFSYRESHDYKTGAGGYRIGYASSDDLQRWIRQDERAGLRPSGEGWDSSMVNYPNVFMVDRRCFMLYQGNEMGRAGFGLARLRDGADWGRR
jgi:predicted GH43/DUF377 family glycosyl hydrolase